MAGEISRQLRGVRDRLLSNPVSPRVETPADINAHYCRFVAETVVDRLDDDHDVRILADGGRGFAHVWLESGGWHYDAECVDGVADHRDLPFFQRHPGAAVNVEPGDADLAALRRRGLAPLYPEL